MKLQKVKRGDPITADHWNHLVDALEAALAITVDSSLQIRRAGHSTHLKANVPRFDLVEIADNIEPGDKGKTVNVVTRDNAAVSDDPEKWKQTGYELGLTTDPQQGLYLAGERPLAYFHPASGERFPLPGVLFHLGIVAADIAAGDEGTVRVWRFDAGDEEEQETDFTLTIRDWTNEGFQAGARVFVFQHLQSRKWHAIHAGGGTSRRVISQWRFSNDDNAFQVKTIPALTVGSEDAYWTSVAYTTTCPPVE